MAESSKDTGVMPALLERFETQRLPRALALKAKVDRGELLGGADIEFLDQVFNDSQHLKPLSDKHPQWQPLVARVGALYKEITDKAWRTRRPRRANLLLLDCTPRHSYMKYLY